MHAQFLSHVRLFATPWTIACQVPLSMDSSRQEYWSGLTFSIPGDLPDLGIKPVSPASPALAGRFFTSALPGKPGTPLTPSLFMLSSDCHRAKDSLLFSPSTHILLSLWCCSLSLPWNLERNSENLSSNSEPQHPLGRDGQDDDRPLPGLDLGLCISKRKLLGANLSCSAGTLPDTHMCFLSPDCHQ